MSGRTDVERVGELVQVANELGHEISYAAVTALVAQHGYEAAREQIVTAARLVNRAVHELQLRVAFEAARLLCEQADGDLDAAIASLRVKTVGLQGPDAAQIYVLAAENGLPITRATAARYARQDPNRLSKLVDIRDSGSRHGERIDLRNARAARRASSSAVKQAPECPTPAANGATRSSRSS